MMSLLFISLIVLSLIILPSSIVIIRSPYSNASSLSCVITITNLSREISFKCFSTIVLVSLSSEPVGSSASNTSDDLTIALAIATLCFVLLIVHVDIFFHSPLDQLNLGHYLLLLYLQFFPEYLLQF